ncbi:hypothetical protein AZE42_14014 [Rhizopogon vesiculosus]|uniref:Uncharacterized protein n=1 Tax=Rhizopogon vesiculosus TaxID=180088 RepID=A0A1J8QML5_9AGAM|nr:hypothetical protein AZE42_14014 [Rhizopogon vesiculosus]
MAKMRPDNGRKKGVRERDL